MTLRSYKANSDTLNYNITASKVSITASDARSQHCLFDLKPSLTQRKPVYSIQLVCYVLTRRQDVLRDALGGRGRRWFEISCGSKWVTTSCT